MAKRDYRKEYRMFQSSPEMISYRAELNKANKDNPNSKKGDKMDMSHKGGKLSLENESVNRGRTGEGGRKKGTRIKKRRADKGMLVKKSPKMYLEGGVENVAAEGEDERGFFRRLMDLFKDRKEEPAPMKPMKPTYNFTVDNNLPEVEIVGSATPSPESNSTGQQTDSEVLDAGFLPFFPLKGVRDFTKRKRKKRFQEELDALGPGYRKAIDAAIFKETGGAGLGKAGYDAAENMSYSEDGKRLAEVFYNSFDKLGYGTGERVKGEDLGRRPREEGYPVLDTLAIGRDYGRQPEKLGDEMYGDRGGYKYRGRGYLQITNEPMYKQISKDLYGDPNVLVDNPDLILENPEIAQNAAISYLNRTRKGTLKHISKQNLLETDKVEDMGQADLNLLVVLQVSGGKLGATTLEGLKKMDAETGVERDYEYLVNNYKTPRDIKLTKNK